MPAKVATISICDVVSVCTYVWDRDGTYTLLYELNIIEAYTNSPRSAQVPRSFERQVLDGNAGQNHHLRVDLIENRHVAQIEAICNLRSDKSYTASATSPASLTDSLLTKIPVLSELVRRLALVLFVVYLAEEVLTARDILRPGPPGLLVEAVVPIFRRRDGDQGEHGFERLADAHDADGLYEAFAQTPHECFSSRACRVAWLGDEMRVQVCCKVGFAGADEARKL